VKYLDPEGVVREKKREQMLRDLGYRIVRWLASEIMLHPAVVLARIGRALGW
jgi:very-short-patch-repair endonuclease